MPNELGVDLPIIQAPMAGVSTPALAAAVSNAGGLGSLGIGASSLEHARAAIEATRALTSRPFNVNVFCHRSAQRNVEIETAWLAHLAPLFAELRAETPERLQEIYATFVGDGEATRMILDSRPAVVSFHFGLPNADQIAAIRGAGIKTMATATNVREAVTVEAAGIDVVIAQGIEAGGHRGVFDPDTIDECLPTQVLTRLLVKRSKLPVVSAGGIMEGQGIRAALALGASATQLGTAFILCPESAAPLGYRAAMKSDRAATTRLTRVLSGRPARGIVNRFIDFGEAAGSPAVAPYPVAYDAAKQLHAAALKRSLEDFAAQWAGQGAPLAREMPAGELIRLLAGELGL